MFRLLRPLRESSLSKQKHAKYVGYALGEILLIVVGILIALQLDNWNQGRIDKNKAYENLNLLKRDLARDVEVLSEFRGKIRRQAEGAQLILNSIGGSNIDTIEIEKAFAELYLTWAYTPQQPTYLGLRNGAQLDLVRDIDLRSLIIDYYEVRQTRFQMEYVRDYSFAQRLLHENFSNYVRFLPPERSTSLFSAPDGGHWTLLVSPISNGADDVNFLNDLSEFGARAFEILGVIDALKAQNIAIQEAIQKHLANST
jgi:hypothetical protein